MNEDFKVKLTPKDESPVYSQSLPTRINLEENILVELALLNCYRIITTLPFSKYASPKFDKKKPNGKLRLLVDLRKITNLISDDYINNDHPVSTLTDAAQHMAGKSYFVNWTAPIAYKWRTNGPLKCLLQISPAEPSRIEDWPKDSAEPYRPSLVSCANT